MREEENDYERLRGTTPRRAIVAAGRPVYGQMGERMKTTRRMNDQEEEEGKRNGCFFSFQKILCTSSIGRFKSKTKIRIEETGMEFGLDYPKKGWVDTSTRGDGPFLTPTEIIISA